LGPRGRGTGVSPDGYELHHAKFVQEVLTASAANALTHPSAVCPPGIIRNYLGIGYYPSAAETRTVLFHLVGRGGLYFPITRPLSVALDSVYQILTPLTEGMEIKSYPGDYIRVVRDVATAGSTMNLCLRFIDTDLPYFSYDEPLKKVIRQTLQRSGPTLIGGRVGSSPPAGFGGGVPGGGRGGRGPEPI